MKYRKKPIVVEAFQINKENRRLIFQADRQGLLLPDWFPVWLQKTSEKKVSEINEFFVEKVWSGKMPERKNTCREIYIHTLEGCHKVSMDEWIIKGINNDLYLCKPDIFKKTYEKVDETTKSYQIYKKRNGYLVTNDFKNAKAGFVVLTKKEALRIKKECQGVGVRKETITGYLIRKRKEVEGGSNVGLALKNAFNKGVAYGTKKAWAEANEVIQRKNNQIENLLKR